MKKLLAITTATMLSFAGVVGASVTATAVGGNPTFNASTLEATVGEAFDTTLIPTYSTDEFEFPAFTEGSVAYFDGESCSLPAGLSYIQNGQINGAGVAPTFQIAGTPEVGTEGEYTLCFYTESIEEGGNVGVGGSQTVTLTVNAPAPVSYSVTASANPVAEGESTTITTDAPAENSVGVFVDGVLFGTDTVSALTAEPINWALFGGEADVTVSFRVYEPGVTEGITAETPAAGSVDVVFSASATPPPPPPPPVEDPTASAVSPVSGVVGQSLSSDVEYTSANFVWSETATVSAIGLPDGVSVAVDYYNEDGSPALLATGTPSAAGDYTSQITITDGAQSASFEQVFNISDARSVEIESTATFVNGVDSSSDFSLTVSGGWDWSFGGTVILEGLPTGLSYTVNDEWVDDTIPSFTIYGIANDVAGDYTITATVNDDYELSSTAEFTITVEDAPAPTLTITPGSFSSVVGEEVDLTFNLEFTGLNFAEGFEGDVLGLPAGLEYEFLTDESGFEPVAIRIFGIPTEADTGSLAVTVTDANFDTASNEEVSWEVTAAPVVIATELVLDRGVGQNINGANADYAAEGLKEGTEWTLTLRSTPQIIAEGVVGVTGIINGVAAIPAGLAAGWHSLTLDATDVNGNAVSKVVWFELNADGNILAVQDAAPTPAPQPELAKTGSDVAGLAGFALLLAVAGAGSMLAVRRKVSA